MVMKNYFHEDPACNDGDESVRYDAGRPSPPHARNRVWHSADLIATRGYRTVTVKAELKRLGFSDRQCLTPGLLLPIWDLNGDIASYQFRPDQPQLNRDGKVTKYETPQGSTMILDVSPVIHDQLRDVGVPLLITEGLKKADAAISQGGGCVALLGVWNWRGKDAKGATRMLPEFERIPLRGRLVTSFSTPTCSRSRR